MKEKTKLWSNITSFPARAIALSFFAVIFLGTVMLMLPVASKDGNFTNFFDALFTATSATCVTGLVVFDTFSKWTIFGQLVILMLIQIGGLGLVTITMFFNVALGKKLGLKSMQLAQESINTSSIEDISRIIRFVVTASLSVEIIGAIMLSFTFVPKYGADGIFISIFLAVSAFCNAGFDILGREGAFVSLCNYTDSFNVNFTISALVIMGGLGFLVWKDLYNYKKSKKLALHTKIVLTMTGILLLLGFFMFLLLEWNNPATLGGLTLAEKFGAAFFQSVTTRTAGFNTIDFAQMNSGTKICSSILMFIGAAPGSTGGGIKITTAMVLFMTVYSVIRGKDETIIMNRVVHKNTVYKSLAILMMALLGVSICSAVMINTLHISAISGVDSFFESVSAFATVGLSCGVTAMANLPSKILLIALMFAGRVGPVSFALSLAMRSPGKRNEVLPDAKILVG